MSEKNQCSGQFDTQLVLLVVSLCFHLFQAVVVGMKWRVKCKNCLCSCRTKGSSPSPPSDTTTGETPTASPESPNVTQHVVVVTDK